MLRLLLTLALTCAACRPSPPAFTIAKYALLERGYHALNLRDYTMRCFPATGFEFSATTAMGERVHGVVCCGSTEGEVWLDGVQHP